MTQRLRSFEDGQFISQGDPAWIKDMHAHYAMTGSYRSQDVRRVLGSPQQGVAVSCLTSSSCNLIRAMPASLRGK